MVVQVVSDSLLCFFLAQTLHSQILASLRNVASHLTCLCFIEKFNIDRLKDCNENENENERERERERD